MTDKKPPKPASIPAPRPGRFGESSIGSVKTQKSFTTNYVPDKIGKPKPGSGK